MSRDRVEKVLNDEYEKIINENHNLMATLEFMIRKYPYKISSAFPMDVTDCVDINAQLEADYSICQFSHHKEFVRAVREAERDAKSGQNGYYTWRGYRGYVAPNLPPITSSGLVMRLMNALQQIPSISDPEKMVKV